MIAISLTLTLITLLLILIFIFRKRSYKAYRSISFFQRKLPNEEKCKRNYTEYYNKIKKVIILCLIQIGQHYFHSHFKKKNLAV